MKRIFQLLIVLFVSLRASAQADSLAPYKRFPAYPPVKLLMADSSSYFTKDMLPKKTPVFLIVFNPECDHCQHETEEILKNIDRFKNIRIVMATMAELRLMKDFIQHYNLGEYENITVGRDTNYFLMTFFHMHNMPFLAFYNRKKELISVFEGSMPVEKVLEELKK